MQHGKRSFSVFTVLAFAILTLFFIQAAGVAFLQLGIPIWMAIVIVPGSLIGSLINIPLYTIESNDSPCTQEPYVQYWGVSYQVFQPDCPGKTRISINLGGAIIPIVVSAYLLLLNILALAQFLIATTLVTLFVHRIAKIKPDVGILTPGFLPAFAAVAVTLMMMFLLPGGYNGYSIAYVSGTLGTLIGADILNLNKMSELRTGEASIGGAGTFDGVFLTGILAVFLL